ncbi:MAG: type II toxin-antitoxin system HicA family toxin [Burkholderiales bacterium]|nr:type II toxin-antitoxin system HicA family toxin [Burkholderiales bacterium]
MGLGDFFFHDPISGNIHWREIESLLHYLGAVIEPLSGARLRVKLNGVEGIPHRPHHSNTLDKNGVKALREYLARAQVTPSLYETKMKSWAAGWPQALISPLLLWRERNVTMASP